MTNKLPDLLLILHSLSVPYLPKYTIENKVWDINYW